MAVDDKYKIKNYYPTIGIECHVQLKTKTKLFAGVDNDARNAEPNTLISHICFGLPGSLPVLNKQAIFLASKAAFALNTFPQHFSKFDRKHYFYPDLPMGYQITQFDEPIILNGNVNIELDDGSTKQISVERAHLEADAGKSTHQEGLDYSLVDLNRAGTPLLEIVSGPDMHSSEEAKAYASELYILMKYADVSEVDLYHGNMRFDVNVSVSKDAGKLGTRTETKNLNSFRSVANAVDYEIKRQIEELEAGRSITQETRGWNDSKQKTFSQRSKEDAHDYRYFPDPDIPPVVLSEEYIDKVKSSMSIMPSELRKRLKDVGVSKMIAETLIDNIDLMAVWQKVAKKTEEQKTLKRIADWLSGEVVSQLSDNPNINLKLSLDSDETVLNVDNLIKLSNMVSEGSLSSTSAKTILATHWTNLYDPEQIAKELDLLQVSDDNSLEEIVKKVIAENIKAADDVKAGETKVIGFLVGQVMKASRGQANPAKVQAIIKKQLEV